jgi:hypothetical protein
LDNDIILKLATCDLFQDTIKTFDIEPTQVKILDSFKYKFKRETKRKRGNKANQTPQYNIEKALEVTQDFASLNESIFNQDILDIYTELVNYSNNLNDKDKTIDKGEAILISYVSYYNQQGESNYLLTGDKRCLRALVNSEFTDIIQSLNGKVWCFEQLILKNIENNGFEFVKNKIIPVLNNYKPDTALKAAFSNDKVTQENSILTLKSYVKSLREETGYLLNSYNYLF